MGFAGADLGVERIAQEFKNLRRIIFDNPEFFDFLKSPEFMLHEKEEALEKVFNAFFSEQIKQFVYLLLDKKRIGLLVDIADFIRLNFAHVGLFDAILKTSYPLELELVEAIKNKMERKLGKKLNFYLELDASLGGGVQVVVGNTVYDGSVQKRLSDLKNKLENIMVA